MIGEIREATWQLSRRAWRRHYPINNGCQQTNSRRCDDTIIFDPLPICERICRNGSSLARLPNLISARWRMIYPPNRILPSIAVPVHRLPPEGWKQTTSIARNHHAARRRGRVFFRARRRQAAGKRSPATIYGGLRLAGTLVLLHRCCRALILPFLITAAAGGTEQNGFGQQGNRGASFIRRPAQGREGACHSRHPGPMCLTWSVRQTRSEPFRVSCSRRARDDLHHVSWSSSTLAVEPLSKPVVDRREEIMGFGSFALIAPKAGEIEGRQ
jgi:hypothetical protein